jgi:5-methylcytosine-specific restriction endonuclease McrA
MANPAYAYGALQKPKPKLLAKRKATREKTKDWIAVRRIVLARDKHRCRACSQGHGLDVHHVIARSLGGGDVSENLIALCRHCHSSVHGHVLILRYRDAAHPAKTLRCEWVK